jgi:hypothetical protein
MLSSINGFEHPSARFGLNRESGVLTDAQERQLGLSVVQQAQQQNSQNSELDPRMKAALASFGSRLVSEIASKGLTGALQTNYAQEWEQLKTVSQQIDLSRRQLAEGHTARTALIVNNPSLDEAERQRRLQMEEQLRLMEEARIAELERRRREAEENLRLLNQVTASQRTLFQATTAANEADRRSRQLQQKPGERSSDMLVTLDDDFNKWLDKKIQQDHWGVASSAEQVVSSQLQTEVAPDSHTDQSNHHPSGLPARRQVMEILLRDRATKLTSTRTIEVEGANSGTLLNEGRAVARSTAFSPIQFVTMTGPEMGPESGLGIRFGNPLNGSQMGSQAQSGRQDTQRPNLFPGERVGFAQA